MTHAVVITVDGHTMQAVIQQCRTKHSLLVLLVPTSGFLPADRFLPDKAIDLVDEAAARLKMEATSKPEALDEIERKVS